MAKKEQEFPEPTAGALIFNKDGKIFLMRSHKWRGKWVMPGGHIELGETIEQALRREVFEETGLKVYGIRFLGIQEFIFDKAFWKKRHFIFFDFACKTRGSKVKLNDEGSEYGWFTPKEAFKMETEPYTKRAIRMCLKS
ncbi:MAG: NUDIX domain-containing protein [Candidatus Anstonellales archaeon]